MLKRIRAAIADGHLNKAPDWLHWKDALIFREEQRAIGEEMIVSQGDQRVVMSYGVFSSRYCGADKPRWLRVAERFLVDLAPENDFRRTRLTLLTVALTDLIERMEPSRMTDRLRETRHIANEHMHRDRSGQSERIAVV